MRHSECEVMSTAGPCCLVCVEESSAQCAVQAGPRRQVLSFLNNCRYHKDLATFMERHNTIATRMSATQGLDRLSTTHRLFRLRNTHRASTSSSL